MSEAYRVLEIVLVFCVLLCLFFNIRAKSLRRCAEVEVPGQSA